MPDTDMEFTPDLVTRLRAAYEDAVANEFEMFEFSGVQILTTYAKYLLEYLEAQPQSKGGRRWAQ